MFTRDSLLILIMASTAWFILVEVRVVKSGVSAKESHIQVYDIKSTQVRVRFLYAHKKDDKIILMSRNLTQKILID